MQVQISMNHFSYLAHIWLPASEFQPSPLVPWNRPAEDHQWELGLQYRGRVWGKPGTPALFYQDHCSWNASLLWRTAEVSPVCLGSQSLSVCLCLCAVQASAEWLLVCQEPVSMCLCCTLNPASLRQADKPSLIYNLLSSQSRGWVGKKNPNGIPFATHCKTSCDQMRVFEHDRMKRLSQCLFLLQL